MTFPRRWLQAAEFIICEHMEKTILNSRELKRDSVQYANQVFDHLAANIGSTLNVVQQAKADLNQGQDD